VLQLVSHPRTVLGAAPVASAMSRSDKSRCRGRDLLFGEGGLMGGGGPSGAIPTGFR